MRIIFTIIFAVLIIALLYCAHVARKSGKDMGIPVMHMLLALIPPIVGNLIIIASSDQTVSTIGYYIYFLGMDLVVMVLLQFSMVFCGVKCNKTVSRGILLVILLDMAQILSNPFLGRTFTTEKIMAYGAPYYRLIPYMGQTFHRVVDYAVIFAVVAIFFIKIRQSNRYYSEKYTVILAVMIVTIIWETAYIFSRSPVDRSMLGFGVFGLLVFYFSLYYRPFRLLDRMLSEVASNMPDALYCFDTNGECIWVNKKGMELVGAEQDDYREAASLLGDYIGCIGKSDGDWSDQRVVGSGENVKSYVIEHRVVKDGKGHNIGYFLNIRDNTTEQNTLRHEIYNATHDSLTQLYNRAGYDLLVKSLDSESNVMMILLDVDKFKEVNDEHGHHIGDLVLQKVARTIERCFRSNDYICRVGGDEFVILMANADMSQHERIKKRIVAINEKLSNTSDGLPKVTVSAGVAYGDKSTDPGELFDHADQALYTTKREGRSGVTLFTNDKDARGNVERGLVS